MLLFFVLFLKEEILIGKIYIYIYIYIYIFSNEDKNYI